MSAVTDLQQATTTLNAKLSIALQGDYINPVDFGARSGEYCDEAFAKAIAAALRPADAPTAQIRYAYKPIVIPAGHYLFKEPLRIWSVQNLTFVGLMSGIGTNYAEEAFPTLLEFKGDMETGLDLNGCAHSTLANFTVVGSVGIGGADDCPNRLIWLRNSSNSDPLSTTTRNQFYNIRTFGHFRESGFCVGQPLNTLQEDLTTISGCEVTGDWKPGEETKWQSGFYFGTGVMGNNLNHSAYAINSRGCKNNIVIDATNVAIYGGTIQNADCDIDIRGLQGYFYCTGIRTENSRQFLRGHVPTSVVQQAIVENCEVRLNEMHALFDTTLDYQDDLPQVPTEGTASPPRLSQRWLDLLQSQNITGASGRPRVHWVNDSQWRIVWNDKLTYTVLRQDGKLYISDSSWVSWNANGMLRLANIRVSIRGKDRQPGIVPTIRLGANANGFLLAEGVAVRHPLLNEKSMVEAYGHAPRVIMMHCYGMDEDANVTAPIPFHMIGNGRGRMLPGTIATYGIDVTQIPNPPAPLLTLEGDAGSTTYTYYLIAKDSAGRRTLPSPVATISNGPDTLNDVAKIRIAAAGSFDAIAFDILKGDTSTLLATDVPVGTLMRRAFFDVGQETEPYTPPATNETGQLALTGTLHHGGSAAGFFGANPTAKPVVTGSWRDNTAGQSLVAALAALGLVDDQTTL